MTSIYFFYSLSFLSIYAAINSMYILYGKDIWISGFKKQENIYNLIYNKKDFLSAYYYEISLTLIIFASILYAFVYHKMSLALIIFSIVLLSFVLLITYFNNYVYQIKYVLDKIKNFTSFSKYLKNNRDMYDFIIDETSYLSFDKNINVSSYDTYAKDIMKFSFKPIDREEWYRYSMILDNRILFYDNNDLYVHYKKEKLAKKINIVRSDLYYNMISEDFVSVLIKQRVIESFLFTLIFYFLER